MKSIGVQSKEVFCRNKYLNNNVEDRIKLVPVAKNFEQKRSFPNGGYKYNSYENKQSSYDKLKNFGNAPPKVEVEEESDS